MVCYIIPSAAAIVHYISRKKIPNWKGRYHLWLNLLFLGGAIFGVVDHLWNGELFLVGDRPMIDVLLGVVITAAILVIWLIIVYLDKKPVYETSKNIN